jgi:uncharacterized protein YunC (DUF1805 family)
MNSTNLEIDNKPYSAHLIETSKAKILMIQASDGFLACGYFDIETANKLNEAVAIVTGVSTYEDMLTAKVVKISKSAQEKGLTLGITGKEALNLLN